MTDCPNVAMRELLPELLHDALTDAERVQVEGHLATCEDCAAELALLRSAQRAMRGVRVPAFDTASIVAALPRPATRRPESRSTVRTEVRRSSNLFRIAAAVTFVSLGAMSLAITRSYFGTSPVAIVDTAISGESAQQTALQAAPPLASADTPVARNATARGMSVHTALGDLNDAELESLLSELDQLEAAPLAEPESTPGGRVVGNATAGS
jgi:anti-sigma factor RsiW